MISNSLNFVRGHDLRSILISYILGFIGTVLFLVSIYLILQTQVIREQIEPLKQRISILNQKKINHSSVLIDAPTDNELDKLAQRIRDLSSKLSLDGQRVSGFLYEIEKSIPSNAYVTEFEYPDHDGFVRILLLLESETEMSNVLQRLENNENINSVVLSGQSRKEENKNSVIADIQLSIK